MPHKSWDEIPSDKLETVVLIDPEEPNDKPKTRANATTAANFVIQIELKKQLSFKYRLLRLLIALAVIVLIRLSLSWALMEYQNYHPNMADETRRWLYSTQEFNRNDFLWNFMALVFAGEIKI